MFHQHQPDLFDPTIDVTIPQKPWLGWIVVGLGVLCCLVKPNVGLFLIACGALLVFVSRGTLTLSQHGFEVSRALHPHRHAWSDIREFVEVRQTQFFGLITVNKFVGYNMVNPNMAAAAWFARTFGAAERYLPPGFTVKTEELVVAMELRRQFAASGARSFVPQGQAPQTRLQPAPARPSAPNWSEGAAERYASQAAPQPYPQQGGFGRAGLAGHAQGQQSGGFGRRQTPVPSSSGR